MKKDYKTILLSVCGIALTATFMLLIFLNGAKGFTHPVTPPPEGAPGPISIISGGTGATSTAAARANLGAAGSGVNSDITSLTPLSGVLNIFGQLKINNLLTLPISASAPTICDASNGGAVYFNDTDKSVYDCNATSWNKLGAVVPAAGSIVYSTPGTYIWTVPDGVIGVLVQMTGGGGGSAAYYVCGAGEGGGGGAYVYAFIHVTPNSTVTTVVGAGGAGGISTAANFGASGQAGGSSLFGSVSAAGGGGGVCNNGSSASSGGGATLGQIISFAGGTSVPYTGSFVIASGGGGAGGSTTSNGGGMAGVSIGSLLGGGVGGSGGSTQTGCSYPVYSTSGGVGGGGGGGSGCGSGGASYNNGANGGNGRVYIQW